jgi:hypothetical protein
LIPAASELLREADEDPSARSILGGKFSDAGSGTQQITAIQDIDGAQAQRQWFMFMPRVEIQG